MNTEALDTVFEPLKTATIFDISTWSTAANVTSMVEAAPPNVVDPTKTYNGVAAAPATQAGAVLAAKLIVVSEHRQNKKLDQPNFETV
jgi:hypothetical protein